MAEIAWRELQADEILGALQHAAEATGWAVSGWLDVHQWAPLGTLPGIELAAPCPEAQFRLAGLNCKPELRVAKLNLAGLSAAVRHPRTLRRKLEQATADPAKLGDMLLLGEVAWLALQCDAEISLDSRPLEIESGWPDTSPASQSQSCASLRLDAVVARVFNVGRAEAQIAIEHGFVWVNFRAAAKPAQHLAINSVLVFRGKGRAKLLGSVANLRSGRVMLTYALWPV